MENKGNFPACVYIKANVKRVCIFGADPSSAARVGLSGGTRHGFMASRPPLPQDARIQTRILHSYPDDAKGQEVEWDLRCTGGEKLARRQPFCSSLSAHTHLGASGGAAGGRVK